MRTQRINHNTSLHKRPKLKTTSSKRNLSRPNEKLPWWPKASSKTCVNAILGILADADLYTKHQNIFSDVSFCFCHELLPSHFWKHRKFFGRNGGMALCTCSFYLALSLEVLYVHSFCLKLC